MENPLKDLGYSEKWLLYGFLDQERLEEQAAELASADDPNTEHYRYGSFRRLLSSRSTLPDAEIGQYIELATEDSDFSMGQAALCDLAQWENLSEAACEALSSHAAFQEAYLRRALARGKLARDLRSARVTADECDVYIRDGEAALQRMLLEGMTLSREQLERLREGGRSRTVRNMATAMLRMKVHHNSQDAFATRKGVKKSSGRSAGAGGSRGDPGGSFAGHFK